jgi:hypothetical protein
MTADALITELASLTSTELSLVINTGVAILASRTNGHREEQPDELLTVEQAAPLLHKSRSWLYHNHKDLPFKVNGLGGTPRFSRRGLEKYISDRARR